MAGTIKRVTEYLNPRVARITALHLPARPEPTGYVRPPRGQQTYVPDHATTLTNGT